MRNFTIDSEDQIACPSPDEASAQTGVERFCSARQLEALSEGWPRGRLIRIWNTLPGVRPVKKFRDRKTAIARIWNTIQRYQPVEGISEPKVNRVRSRRARTQTDRENTKTAQVIALLKQPEGATLVSIMKATGWQAHSVRGFLSGHLRKKLGLRVKSFRRDGERAYAVRG